MRRFQPFIVSLSRFLCLIGIPLSLFIVLGSSFVFRGKAAPESLVHEIYMPFVVNDGKSGPVLLGIYPTSYWQPTLEEALSKEFSMVDTWSGKQLSLAGIFHSFDQYNTVDYMLSTIWDAGYTPFVNLYSNQNIQNIAAGSIDNQIRTWARNFKSFSNNGQRMAYLAPLQEMNGDWVPYGSSNPAYFKTAFQRIVNIFDQEGVPSDSVRWVFAPNGASSIGWPGFEDYYPGDSIVDVVGFSSYNYGFSPNVYPVSYRKWETPDQLFTKYIDRMRIMAPSKPIFIAQTGTTAYGQNGYDISLKNQWLESAYHLVSKSDGVWGILYYNASNNYDWAFYLSDRVFEGYKEGVSLEIFQYVPPTDLVNVMLAP